MLSSTSVVPRWCLGKLKLCRVVPRYAALVLMPGKKFKYGKIKKILFRGNFVFFKKISFENARGCFSLFVLGINFQPGNLYS
jgi:hypothetical protein